tara:strand:- start:520 stop:678 length:159 start_codon:yes stop_codon:yes gene_type:complete
MIRFVLGFMTIIAGVAAVEGTAGIPTGIFLAAVGTIIMLWGAASMEERGELP